MTVQRFFEESPYFEPHEFDSKDTPGSHTNMNPQFLVKLEAAREWAGVPFVITSGYRTPKHNARQGGVNNSSHTTGHAADIRCNFSADRYKIITALMIHGFTRIGIGKNFIHVDDDPTKVQQVIWGYWSGEAQAYQIPLSDIGSWWKRLFQKKKREPLAFEEDYEAP